MKQIKSGFLLGLGMYLAFQFMGMISTAVFVAIGLLLNALTGGMISL